MKSLLNIGSGKISIDDFPDFDCVVHLDQSYAYGLCSTIAEIEERMASKSETRRRVLFCGEDIFTFMDTFKFKFSHINADRIFEHMFYDCGEVGRLLDACNQITEDDGTMTIIVPNAADIARLLLEFEDDEKFFTQPSRKIDAMKILVNTELQNTKSDPHGSSWSPKLAASYIQSEGGTWRIDNIVEQYFHKGRSIYMKIECSKPR